MATIFFADAIEKRRGCDIVISHKTICAPVAQLDRAIASGAIGRRFESCRAHHFFTLKSASLGFSLQKPAKRCKNLHFQKKSPTLFISFCEDNRCSHPVIISVENESFCITGKESYERYCWVSSDDSSDRRNFVCVYFRSADRTHSALQYRPLLCEYIPDHEKSVDRKTGR